MAKACSCVERNTCHPPISLEITKNTPPKEWSSFWVSGMWEEFSSGKYHSCDAGSAGRLRSGLDMVTLYTGVSVVAATASVASALLLPPLLLRSSSESYCYVFVLLLRWSYSYYFFSLLFFLFFFRLLLLEIMFLKLHLLIPRACFQWFGKR